MNATCLGDGAFPSPRPCFARLNDELVELMLFLPRRQAATLEAAAHDRGLTVGAMIRQLIGDFTARQVAGKWKDGETI